MCYTGTINLSSISGEIVVAKNDFLSLRLAGHKVFQYNLSNFNKGLFNKLLKPLRLFIFPYEIYYVRKKIKEINPDVIHLHTISPYISISLLIYLSILEIPVVQTLHNVRWVCLEGAYYRKGKYCNKCSGKNGFSGVVNMCNKNIARSLILFFLNRVVRINKFLFKSIKYFIPVSDFVRREHVSNGFPDNKMVTKLNSIDLDNLKVFSTKNSMREGIIFSSRISKSKGSDILKIVIKQIRDPIYVLGDGPELVSLKKYCNNNHYNHVHFLGKVNQDKCMTYMASALCTVVPSQCGESFSLVAAESMSLGIPVIGSNIGGLGDLLRESGAGIAVNSSRSQEFIDAINTLKSDKVMYELFSKNGKKYAYSHLNLKKNSLALIDIYKKAINNRV